LHRDIPDACDPRPKLGQRFHAIGLSKGLPSHIDGHMKKACKESAASNRVVRGFQLEENHFAGLKCFEANLRRWTPEVNFIDVGLRDVKGKPVVVGHGHVETHFL
jgi:hypothetical protein